MLDVRIVGGEIIDGTGAPRRRADVGIRAGRIVLDGAGEPATRTIDAEGLVVAPGFVDPHTHLDAQALWDPHCGPSLFHGVTTVIGGNCGFTIAPLGREADTDYIRAMLARVEGMPLDALLAGPAWDWRSFGEWLGRLDGSLALNAGFLVGHSTVRRAVMGERAVGAPATVREIAAMCELATDALAAGALGVSSSLGATHYDGDGKPVPSRAAAPAELVALARALRDRPGTIFGINPGTVPFDESTAALLCAIAVESARPVTWNALIVDAARPAVVASALELADRAAALGGTIVAQVVPDPRLFYLSFANGFILDSFPGWGWLFTLDPAARLDALRDPSVRARLRAGAAGDDVHEGLTSYRRWEHMTVVGPIAAAGVAGCTIGALARGRDGDPFDTLVDLVCANGLATSFTPLPQGDDPASWQLRAALWNDPRTVIGAADAGAHVDNASSFTYTTALLGPSVRDRALLSLEAAVRELTSVPAALCGLVDRGQVAEGWFADLVVFDPATIGPGPVTVRTDLPGGARRLYAEARGIHHVLVNGVEVVADGRAIDARPGVVLRSGRDAR
jgi:N-acyl-D-aspartate/D-glutamate deacylase